MKRINLILIALLAVMLLVTAVGMPHAQANSYRASSIQKVDQVKVNYKDYLDSSVMYQLPESVSSKQEISVIISLDEADLMDAYEQTNQTMAFSEFVLQSQQAEAVRQQILSRKAEVLARLDEAQISYTTGEDYDTLLAGFEIRIQAGDFAATCKSLNKGEQAIIGEEYQVAETKLVENTVNVYDTGIFKTVVVRGWMSEIGGIKRHYLMQEGDHVIEL